MTRKTLSSSAALILAVSGLGACSTVGSLTEEPQLTPISNPETIIGAIPPTAPVPQTYSEPQAANSLWRVGARSFFKDQRASMVGDILTVDIDIADTATLSN